MKSKRLKIASVLITAVLLLSVSAIPALAANRYDVNGDNVINVLDLVRAKKYSAAANPAYNSEFLATLTQVLLGNIPESSGEESSGSQPSSSSQSSSSSHGPIYLPEAP